jgi:hypothetical protein
VWAGTWFTLHIRDSTDHGLKSTHTCGDASPSCDDDDDDDDDDECRAQPQVPVLEVDGMKLSQSQAIATYCGKLTGLYPADPWAAAKCDEVTQLVNQVGAAHTRSLAR